MSFNVYLVIAITARVNPTWGLPLQLDDTCGRLVGETFRARGTPGMEKRCPGREVPGREVLRVEVPRHFMLKPFQDLTSQAPTPWQSAGCSSLRRSAAQKQRVQGYSGGFEVAGLTHDSDRYHYCDPDSVPA